jgi:hypothetical protein
MFMDIPTFEGILTQASPLTNKIPMCKGILGLAAVRNPEIPTNAGIDDRAEARVAPAPVNLETAVGHGRVRRDAVRWQGATTQRARARKTEAGHKQS